MNHIKSFSHTSRVDLDGLFKSVNKQLSTGRVSACYHPYSELKHTWKTCGANTSFKVSDYMDGAPEDVLEALAWYLVCRARGKACPAPMEERYFAYARSEALWAPNREVYKSRARKLSFRPHGNARDLCTVFSYVNSVYFDGAIPEPDLAWVRESPSTRLGFYFPALNILAINQALDSEKVPRYVLEFVVYHELLHGLVEPKGTPKRRLHHTREFREREKAFSMYDDAEKWLRKLARKGRGTRQERIVPQA